MRIKGDEALSRAIILDHYQKPVNKQELDIDMEKENENSESCIDNVTIGLMVANKKIIKAKFDGIACAISTCATDILLSQITDKTISEAKHIIKNFINLTIGKEYDEDLMGEMNCLYNVHKHPIRVKCAQISIKPILKILDKHNA